MKEHVQRIADSGAALGWLAWFFSHVKEINELLQFILLLASIFATIAAGLYHIRKRNQIKLQK
jgi:hypothetical protein